MMLVFYDCLWIITTTLADDSLLECICAGLLGRGEFGDPETSSTSSEDATNDGIIQLVASRQV